MAAVTTQKCGNFVPKSKFDKLFGKNFREINVINLYDKADSLNWEYISVGHERITTGKYKVCYEQNCAIASGASHMHLVLQYRIHGIPYLVLPVVVFEYELRFLKWSCYPLACDYLYVYLLIKERPR
jgi:hypothetical protein